MAQIKKNSPKEMSIITPGLILPVITPGSESVNRWKIKGAPISNAGMAGIAHMGECCADNVFSRIKSKEQSCGKTGVGETGKPANKCQVPKNRKFKGILQIKLLAFSVWWKSKRTTQTMRYSELQEYQHLSSLSLYFRRTGP